jgi:hypothetical protein
MSVTKQHGVKKAKKEKEMHMAEGGGGATGGRGSMAIADSRLTSHPLSPQLRLGPTRDTHCALGYGVGRGRGRGSAVRGGASGEEQAAGRGGGGASGGGQNNRRRICERGGEVEVLLSVREPSRSFS